jgi:predicted acylesterase/phospholipase RssA
MSCCNCEGIATKKCLDCIPFVKVKQLKALSTKEQEYKIETLVLASGVAGCYAIGAIHELEANKKFSSVKRVVGISTGAITALLLAFGADSRVLRKIFSKLSIFSLFLNLDNNGTFYPPNMNSFHIEYAKWNTNKIIPNLFPITNGEWFRNQIEDLIRMFIWEYFREKIINCTFGELESLIKSQPILTPKEIEGKEENRRLKHLHIVTSDMNREMKCFSTENDSESRNIIISDAIRAAVSIPGIMSSHTIHYKQRGHRKPVVGTNLLDGAIANLSLDRFYELNLRGIKSNTANSNGINLLCLSCEEYKTSLPPRTKTELISGICSMLYSSVEVSNSVRIKHSFIKNRQILSGRRAISNLLNIKRDKPLNPGNYSYIIIGDKEARKTQLIGQLIGNLIGNTLEVNSPIGNLIGNSLENSSIGNSSIEQSISETTEYQCYSEDKDECLLPATLINIQNISNIPRETFEFLDQVVDTINQMPNCILIIYLSNVEIEKNIILPIILEALELCLHVSHAPYLVVNDGSNSKSVDLISQCIGGTIQVLKTGFQSSFTWNDLFSTTIEGKVIPINQSGVLKISERLIELESEEQKLKYSILECQKIDKIFEGKSEEKCFSRIDEVFNCVTNTHTFKIHREYILANQERIKNILLKIKRVTLFYSIEKVTKKE